MDALQSLCQFVYPLSERANLLDLRIGLRYCAVVVSLTSVTDCSTRACGLAATLLNEDIQKCCGDCFDIPPFSPGIRCAEMMAALDLNQPLHRSVSLATLNASISLELASGQNASPVTGTPLNIIPDTWEKSRSNELPLDDRNVAMIGYFAPLVPEILARASSLSVCEHEIRRQGQIEGKITIIQSLNELSTMDTVIVTATSLINNTFEQVVNACPLADVIVMGPSAPLIPAYFQTSYPNVKIVAGRVVTDIDSILTVVSQGGGTPRFKNCSRKITMVQRTS